MGWKEDIKKRVEEIVESQKDVAKKIASLVEDQYDEIRRKANIQKKEFEEVVTEFLEVATKKFNKEEKMGMPLLGDKFPTIEVQTTHGKMVIPDDLKGKWTVLFSHPADFTPVCTTEFVSFQKHKSQFDEINTQLIGLSIDQVFSHIKWTEWIKDNLDVEIEFPIIADDTGKVSAQLGLIHPGKGTNTVRAVFIVDPKGYIRAILYYPQELGRNMDEILRMIKGFQVSDKEGVAIPANWPENELIKDEVIIPPAATVEEAKKRPKEYDCFDWWLCHKKL